MSKARISQPGKNTKIKTREEVKETRGHMALRNNVWKIRELLWKECVPLELCLLDMILGRTIGWRQKEAKVKIEEFVEFSGKRRDEVYRALRGLVERGVIRRRKYEHCLYFSLNEDYFGALLIKRHEDALQRRLNSIRVVVDNSKNLDGISVQDEQKFRSTQTEIPSNNETQDFDNIEENRPLKTLLKDISLKKHNPGIFSSFGTGSGKNCLNCGNENPTKNNYCSGKCQIQALEKEEAKAVSL